MPSSPWLRIWAKKIVAAVAKMCTRLERLEVDRNVERDRTWSVPEGLHTLVLADSKIRHGARAVNWWSVARAVAGDVEAAATLDMQTMLSDTWQDLLSRQRLKRMCLRQSTAIEHA